MKEPKHENMEIKSPVEANSGRVTDRGEEPERSGDSMPNIYRFFACNARQNLQADEQESHRRPIRWDELAQHSEVHRFSRGGKCGGCAGKQRVLTWGDPAAERRQEVSRDRSSEQQDGGHMARVNSKPEALKP